MALSLPKHHPFPCSWKYAGVSCSQVNSFDVYYLLVLSRNSGSAMKSRAVWARRESGPGGPSLLVYLTLPLEEVPFQVASMFGARPITLPGHPDILQQLFVAQINRHLV